MIFDFPKDSARIPKVFLSRQDITKGILGNSQIHGLWYLLRRRSTTSLVKFISKESNETLLTHFTLSCSLFLLFDAPRFAPCWKGTPLGDDECSLSCATSHQHIGKHVLCWSSLQYPAANKSHKKRVLLLYMQPVFNNGDIQYGFNQHTLPTETLAWCETIDMNFYI